MSRYRFLILLSLALGISTAWLAVELHAARQEIAGFASLPTPATGAPVACAAATDMPQAQTSPIAISRPDQTTCAHDAKQGPSDATQRYGNVTHNAWVRTWLDDPKKRAKLLADARKMHEQEFPRRLLDLDDDHNDRLLDALAANHLRYAEAMYRCNVDPACDLQATMRNQQEAHRLELVAILGDEKAQRLETYRDNYMERNGVGALRSGLPDSMRMSDTQADELAEALGEERRRLVKEWQQRGEQISSMANSWGTVHFPETQDIGQRVADVTELQRRQRDRATAVLTSAQLDMFTQQQEEMLEFVRNSWEYEQQVQKLR